MQETWVQSLGLVDPLEKEMSTHSRIFAWRIPWTEEPGGLQSMGSQKSRKQLSNQITSSSDCVKSGSHYLRKPFMCSALVDGSLVAVMTVTIE